MCFVLPQGNHIAKGRPIAFSSMRPSSRSYNKARNWRLEAQGNTQRGHHAMVIVGFEEQDDGTTTWRVWDPNMAFEHRGMRDMEDGYINRWVFTGESYSIE